jgi:hypothetical protein
VSFSYRETQVVNGMLLRGDRQHDIAAYFGRNAGRVAEVATGDCAFPNAPPLPPDQLPPPGPYLSKYPVASVVAVMQDAIAAIDLAAGSTGDADVKAGLTLAKETIEAKMASLREV